MIYTFTEIVKSASESSISEASQHSNESSQSVKVETTAERRKSSISGAKSLHEMKSATVEGPSGSSEHKPNEGELTIYQNINSDS